MLKRLEGDCREVLPTLPANCVHTCVTSPPYCGLRSYLPGNHRDKSREFGQEPTIEKYVSELVGVFRQIWRVLVKDGTAWLNLGDAYAKKNKPGAGVKKGDLVGLPWRVALALQADGWFLRSDIIWHNDQTS